jgi:hypothetical protein
MSNARTLFHYFEIALNGAGVKFDSDMRAELMDALESQDNELESLRAEVSALRRQVPDNR